MAVLGPFAGCCMAPCNCGTRAIKIFLMCYHCELIFFCRGELKYWSGEASGSLFPRTICQFFTSVFFFYDTQVQVNFLVPRGAPRVKSCGRASGWNRKSSKSLFLGDLGFEELECVRSFRPLGRRAMLCLIHAYSKKQ